MSAAMFRFTDAPLNAMSFFVADHSPMLKVLIRAVESCQQEDAQSYCAMAQVANLCCIAAATNRCEKALMAEHSLSRLTIEPFVA